MHRHPRKSRLAALEDGEVSLVAAITLRLHLLNCPHCRAIAGDVRSQRAATSTALSALGSRGSAEEAWARFVTVAAPSTGTGHVGLRAAAVLILALPALVLLRAGDSGRATDLQEAAREIAVRPSGPGGQSARPGRADLRFVDALDALRRDDKAAVVRDECCADHDAEGPPDDGLLALRLREPALNVLVMYDDVDRSRSLSRGDLVRWVSLTPDANAMRPVHTQLAVHLR